MNLRAFVRLSRIEHGILTSLIVIASYVIAGGRSAIAMVLLFLSSLLTEIFLFATNDIYNIEEDRINRPDAPLVRGEVSINEAWALSLLSVVIAVLLNVLGIVMGGYLMIWSIVILIMAIVLGFSYNYRLKRVIIVNNAFVAVTSSLTFLYGLYAVSLTIPTLNLPYLLFIVSFLATMGRELVKGAIDVAGDVRAGVKTVANTYGIKTAITLAVIFTLVAVFISPLIIIHAFRNPYGLVLSAGVLITDVILMYISIVLLRNSNYMGRFRVLSLGGAMAITIIAYLLFALLVTVH